MHERERGACGAHHPVPARRAQGCGVGGQRLLGPRRGVAPGLGGAEVPERQAQAQIQAARPADGQLGGAPTQVDDQQPLAGPPGLSVDRFVF